MIPSMLREQASLRPTARTLWEIQEKTGHAPVEVATNLYLDTLKRAENALQEGRERRNSVHDALSLQQYQQGCREAFLRCIGGMPESGPVSADMTGETVHDGFSIQRVVLSPRPGSRQTANVYVPEGRKSPGPAVLLVVGHTDLGKADMEYQCVAQTMARAGFVTLVPDPLGEGERFEQYERDMGYQPIQGCSGEHDLLDWKAKLLGRSLCRYFIQDALAALDYLCAREDVDESRIALTGHYGGGTQTVMLMLAAGERFACAAPCAYVTDHRAMMACGVDPDNEMMWPGSLAAGLDYVDMLAGMAGKPILALTLQHDFFPREGMHRTMAQARDLWQRAGSQSLPTFVTAESGHAYTPELAKAAANFFSLHLMGREAELRDFVFRPLAPEALWCTKEGQVICAYPDMYTVHQDLQAVLDRLKSAPIKLEESIPMLRKMLGADGVFDTPEPRIYDEGVCGHILYRCVAWRPDDAYWNVGALIRDMRRAEDTLPTVIALWPEGTRRMTEHCHFLHRMLQKGYQMLVMDVAGAGALLPEKLSQSNYYIGWGTMYKLNGYLIQLGDSLCALRTRQVMAAIRLLKGWQGARTEEVTLYARGEYSRYGLMASLLTGVKVAADEAFQSYEDIVRENWHDQTNTHEWILPGILQYTDMPLIRAYLEQSGLLLPDPV